MSFTSLSRRGFFKASALAAAAATIGVSLEGCNKPVEPVEPDQPIEPVVRERVKTACHGCDVACGVIAYIENGVVVKLEGDPDAPVSKGSICSKCLNQLHTCYSPRRILHPLKRAGERGENKWEQLSWDEALEYAATNVCTIIDKYGPYSFFTSVGGGGSYSFMNCMTMPWALGSPTIFEPGCAQCWLPRYAMSVFMYGGTDTGLSAGVIQEPYNREDKNFTDALVVWGEQPSVATTAWGGRGMADMRARGTKTVVIDPNFSPDAAKADVWLGIRPHTDTGLLMAWFRYIFENKLYDEAYCKYWTNLPFFIDPDTQLPIRAQQVWPDFVSPTPDNTPDYVCWDLKTNSLQPLVYSMPEDCAVDPEIFATKAVKVDGATKTCKTAGQIYRDAVEEWTLDKAAEVCWLNKDDIEKAIRIYTDAKMGGIALGVATDQTPQSSNMATGTTALDMIMGRVLKPGCMLQMHGASYNWTSRPVQYYNNFAGLTGMMWGVGAVVGMSEEENRARVENWPDKEHQAFINKLLHDRLGMKEHKGLYVWCHSHIPTVQQAILTGEPYKPRLWYDMSGNKLMVLGNAISWYNTFPEIDFIMGQYPMLTSFHVEACDLVFPMREWLEEPVIYSVQQQNYTFMGMQLTHLGETVSHTIANYQLLLKCQEKWGGKLPGGLEYFMGEDSEQTVKDTYTAQFGAPSWEEFRANTDKYTPITSPEEDWYTYNQNEIIVDDGLPAGFPTESRKCEPYVTLLVQMSATGYPFTYPEPMPASTEPYHPVICWIPPNEDIATDTEYPLTLTSGRLPHYHHGTMRQAAFARELYPVPRLHINPVTAKEYGISDGEWVKITSRRGSTAGKALITEGVGPRILWMERFWFPECFDESRKGKITAGWREANVNVLTSNEPPFNEVFGSYSLRGIAVKIGKGSKPDGIWEEPEEFRPFMPTLTGEPITEDVTF